MSFIDDVSIRRVKIWRYLGEVLDDEFMFRPVLEYILNCFFRFLCMFNKLRKLLQVKSLFKHITTYFNPSQQTAWSDTFNYLIWRFKGFTELHIARSILYTLLYMASPCVFTWVCSIQLCICELWDLTNHITQELTQEKTWGTTSDFFT